MSWFHCDNTPSFAYAAYQDASLTRVELVRMIGMSQSALAQIGSGKRAVSSELLERIPRIVDYHPSVPPACYASLIATYTQERGLGTLCVLDSVVRGADGSESGIDLTGMSTHELSLFGLADIISLASGLTGSSTGVHADTHVPKTLQTVIDEVVAS